tara:strand:+ start:824 stop:1324 length:501 start_codon:yes stop_codon:yes gene_type:complete
MPKTAYDFTKEMIFYIIKCNNESITDCYCGSTFDFTKRKASHKTACNNQNNKNYNLNLYKTIRESGGWNSWIMVMIDRKVVKDKLEARQYEQSLIDNHKTTLNSRRAFSSIEDHKQKQAEYCAKYYASHKEQVAEYCAEYYASHKEQQSKYYAEYNAKKRLNLTNV